MAKQKSEKLSHPSRAIKNKSDKRPNEEIVEEVHKQLFQDLAAVDDHMDAAERAYLYYYAHQSSFGIEAEDLQVVINTSRTDTDRKVAKLLDAEPQMVVRGRGKEDVEFGAVWNDLVQYTREWTGDQHDCWEEVLPKVLTQSKQIGEGAAYIEFDPYEEDGWGMIVGEWVNSLHLVWNAGCTSAQWRDAEHLIWFEPKPIPWLEREYPWLKGRIPQQGPDWLREHVFGGGGMDGMDFDDEDNLIGDSRPSIVKDVPMSYMIRRWEKRRTKTMAYRDKETGKPVRLRGEQGSHVLLTTERWNMLPKARQAEYRSRVEEFPVRHVELWETHVVGEELVLNDISKSDKSKGGHGHFPFARLGNIWDPRMPKSRGDIEFQQSYDELLSQMATRWVESMMVAMAPFLDVVKGAIPKSEEHKLEFLGRRPFQQIQRYPGMSAPQWIGTNPTGANLFASGSDFVREIADQASNVFKINQGSMPYSTSGKGIRQLLSEAAVLENLDRIRMKSFLRQETWLRIALIQQYFRQYRVLRITSRVESDEYKLYIGDEEERIKAHFGLEEQFETDADGQIDETKKTGLYKDPDGDMARILPVAEREVGQFDVRLVLDSGRERNKAERQDMVEMFANVASNMPGPLLKWMAKTIEAPDEEGLGKAVDEANEESQMAKQYDELLEMSQMEPDQLKALVEQIGQQAGGQQGAPGGQPAPQGAPAPQEEMLI